VTAAVVACLLVACGSAGDRLTGNARGGAFAEDGPPRAATVWAAGDGADGGPGAAAVARLAERARPDVFLYLGDVYPEGDADAFAHSYAPTFGRIAKLTAPTPGNHDRPDEAQGYRPYWTKVHGTPPPSYYAFRAGGWQLLSLNSELAGEAWRRQLRWLRRRLRVPGTCRLAFWHRPRFSAGTVHGDNPRVAPLWRALHGHARLILNGHEHNMQRFRAHNGLVELIDGAGGHSLYGLRSRRRGLAFADRDTFGAIRLDLRPGNARIAFVDIDRNTLDRSQVGCTGAS
jgi:acid phosphatase type 7